MLVCWPESTVFWAKAIGPCPGLALFTHLLTVLKSQKKHVAICDYRCVRNKKPAFIKAGLSLVCYQSQLSVIGGP